MNILLLSGILSPFWMLVGVYAVGRMFPAYSHQHQFMSELGARTRATEKIQPWVNNYPIGFLFLLFGFSIYHISAEIWIVKASAILFILHGLSHIVAGIFPCDEDLGEKNPSISQIVHNLAGLVMYFSLLIASMLWIFEGEIWLRIYSSLSAFLSVVFLSLMIRSINSKVNVGLYQRLSYGIIALWSCVLSLVLYIS